MGQLAEPYSVTLQAISKHLMVLQEAGVVTKRKVGQQRVVHLEIEHLDLAVVWLENYRRQAEAQYQRLDAVLADLNRTNKPFHERTLR